MARNPYVVFDISKVFHMYFVYRRKTRPEEVGMLKKNKSMIEGAFREREGEIIRSLRWMFGPTTEREIRVWIVDGNTPAPSISKPLLLKCNKNADIMLYILVHELAHRYLDAGVRWNGKKSEWLEPGIKLEALCNFAAETALGSDFVERLDGELGGMKGYRKTKSFMVKNMSGIKAFLGV